MRQQFIDLINQFTNPRNNHQRVYPLKNRQSLIDSLEKQGEAEWTRGQMRRVSTLKDKELDARRENNILNNKIKNLEKELKFNSEFNKDSQGLIDNLKNEKELLQTRINELENEVEETNQGWQEVADEYIKQLEDLSITETKEKFDFNQLFIGISRWWNTQGGSDLIIGGILSTLITILPAIFENAPDGQANFALAIIPLLNSLIATFRKNSNKKEVSKFKKQIDEIEKLIKK